MTPVELGARRLAASGIAGALGGALGYVAGRGWFHVVIGAGTPAVILREQRINFHLALVIALFVAVVTGLVTAELARTEARVDALERWALRAAFPILAVAIALTFAWP
ncbi:MAG: hypothetical protein U0234_21815 [Sandaracinus sp.]